MFFLNPVVELPSGLEPAREFMGPELVLEQVAFGPPQWDCQYQRRHAGNRRSKVPLVDERTRAK